MIDSSPDWVLWQQDEWHLLWSAASKPRPPFHSLSPCQHHHTTLETPPSSRAEGRLCERPGREPAVFQLRSGTVCPHWAPRWQCTAPSAPPHCPESWGTPASPALGPEGLYPRPRPPARPSRRLPRPPRLPLNSWAGARNSPSGGSCGNLGRPERMRLLIGCSVKGDIKLTVMRLLEGNVLCYTEKNTNLPTFLIYIYIYIYTEL